MIKLTISDMGPMRVVREVGDLPNNARWWKLLCVAQHCTGHYVSYQAVLNSNPTW